MIFLSNALTAGRRRLSTKDVLSSKRGSMAEALGITVIGTVLLVAAGVVVANYAMLSRQTSQLQTLSQEITNRAELYASHLNTDLVDPEVPVMTRECSTTPAMCTAILSATPSADGKQTTLRIQGDTVSRLGQTVTKDVTLVSSEVTHVTALDDVGNKVWALSDEGLRYRVWGVATGKPTTIKPEDLTGPGVGASWVTVDDRAGIDSTGALWTWGANNIGQAGIGSISAEPAKPTKFTGATNFRSVVTADDRGYAIDSTGAPWVWGKNDKGQLGLGHNINVLKPTKIAGTRMMTFAVGKDNVFGITMAGDLAVVGASQAGLPANSGFASQIINPGTKYKAVAASTAGAVAMIDASGKLTMAGNNYPYTPMAGGLFTSVTLGDTTGYAMGNNGRLYVWGDGRFGQLGLGSNALVSTPVELPAINVAAVSAGKTSAFVIDVSGNLAYFGKTPSGYVGGTDLPQVSVPTKLLAESRFRGVAANNGDSRVALLDTKGNVYGMGTAAPGLWKMNYLGPNDQPIRMPVPDGFSTFTWK
jgi:hypothetical protein